MDAGLLICELSRRGFSIKERAEQNQVIVKLRLSWVNRTIIFLTCLAGLQLEVHLARAFEPKPDYWFIETLTVGQVNLPAGVTIQTSDPTQTPHAYLFLQNQSETPLFVMSLNYKDVLVMATPDLSWKQRVSAAHEAASYLAVPEKPVYLFMRELVDLDHNLVDRNVLSANSPPPDLIAPEGQSSELLLVYESQVLEVAFRITYTVNTAFDNGSRFYWEMMTSSQATHTASAASTQSAQATPTAGTVQVEPRTPASAFTNLSLLVGLLAGALLGLMFILAWQITRRRR